MSIKTRRLCVVGPMLAQHTGWVTTQGEILAGLLAQNGHPILATSSTLNRYVRFFDTLLFLMRHRKEIDVQFLQVYSGPSFLTWDAASSASKRLGHKIVMHVHGGALPSFAERFPGWVKRVFSRADAIVTPTRYLARCLEGMGFSVQIIPQVIQLSDYPYRHRRMPSPRILWMRTFQDIYNPEMALRVLHRLSTKLPEARLTMAGQEKGSGARVRQLAEELKVADKVRFPGFLAGDEKGTEGQAHDIFINTNHVDNTPVSVIEAAAMGLPIVATAVGGVPDLLTHEQTGLLVPDDDDRAMAEAILRLLDDAELASRLSKNGRALARRSDWENVYPLWAEVFESV